jgi:hypothetical protein
VSDLTAAGVIVTWPVATDPTTASSLASPDAGERITALRARAWAQLFDLRYRLLLGQLQHVLSLSGPLYRDTSKAERGDRTGRGLLLMGTFDEMRRLRKIAGKLVQLPKDDPPGGVHAGPPFELPYTLVLPDREPARWRQHLDTSRAAARLIRDRLAGEQDDFLDDLLARAEIEQRALASLADGQGVPADCLPTGFAKAVTILEEAVRGFSIGAHGAFWAGRTRDEFLDVPVFGQPPIAQGPDGTVVPDPDSSRLIQRLEAQGPGRMPRFRPPVPASRIGYLRNWIAAGCPDDIPAGRVGVAHERDPADEAGVHEPPPGRATGFAADIAGLFRADVDRTSMLFRFDLHRYEDVRDNATAILARLEDGTMPCDGPWSADRISLFRRWINEGRQP